MEQKETEKKLLVNFLVTQEFKDQLVKASRLRNVTLSSFLKMSAAEKLGNLEMNSSTKTSSINQ